jgi:hypothetical protein
MDDRLIGEWIVTLEIVDDDLGRVLQGLAADVVANAPAEVIRKTEDRGGQGSHV